MDESTETPAPKPAILQRLAGLRWEKIGIEMLSVVVGVVLGMQVSNWNDARREKAEVTRLLDQLQPELRGIIGNADSAKRYYASVHGYIKTALAGWRGDPEVSDRDFVIAVYQSTQIISGDLNDAALISIFGSEQLRRIDDLPLRQALIYVIANGTEAISWTTVNTPYRQHVRTLLPEDVQVAIVDRCGDQEDPGGQTVTLPSTCDVPELSDAQVRDAAALLRSHPELIGELRWHFAETRSYLSNLEAYRQGFQSLYDRITASRK